MKHSITKCIITIVMLLSAVSFGNTNLNGQYWFGSLSVDVGTNAPLAKRGTVSISGTQWDQEWDDNSGHHTFSSAFTTTEQPDESINVNFPGETYNIAWNGDVMIHAGSVLGGTEQGFDIFTRIATNVDVNDILGDHSYFGHYLNSPVPGDSCGWGDFTFDPNGTAIGIWTNDNGIIESATMDWTIDEPNATISVWGPTINELGYATSFLGEGGIACSWQIVPEEGRDDLGYAVFIKKTDQVITMADIAGTYQVRFLETGPGGVPYTCGQGTCVIEAVDDANGILSVDAYYSNGEHDVFSIDCSVGPGNEFHIDDETVPDGIISPDKNLIFAPEYRYKNPPTREDYDWLGGIFLIRISDQVRIIYVDDDTPDNNDGSSWATAYKYLQDALTDANSHRGVNEIRVAEGIYRPDETTNDPCGTGDRQATFQLTNGVVLRGGYAGYGEVDPDERDYELYETVLSGDLLGDDEPNFVNYDENSYHIVTLSATEPNTILDGFVITAGNANGPLNYQGGGIFGQGSYSKVSNCVIKNNMSSFEGGGFYWFDGEITNCSIISNTATFGGAIAVCSCIITNCTINGNFADQFGGAIYCFYGEIKNCLISYNNTCMGGGAIAYFGNDYTLSTISNCIISNNGIGLLGIGNNSLITDSVISGNIFAGMDGTINNDPGITIDHCLISGNGYGIEGGFGLREIEAMITNCTIAGNRNGIKYCNGTVITNSIIWQNADSQISHSDVNIVYTNVEGTWPGRGNISIDPLFVEPGYWNLNNTPNNPNDDFWVNGDYHLKSEGWRWDQTRRCWNWDDVTSRCIDAGNPGSPLQNEPLSIRDDPNNEWGENLRINMGAYGGTTEASIPPYGWTLLSDITNDGTANFIDYAHLAEIFIDIGEKQPADFDRDGDVDLTDLGLLVQDWLAETNWH